MDPTDHLRDRIRLFLQVMLIIDVAAYVSDFVMPMLLGNPTPPLPDDIMWLRRGVSVALLAAWSYAKFARPGQLVLILLDGGMTVGLVLAYIVIGLGFIPVYGAVLALLGVVLLLVVRAALVPSPVSRTVAIGLLSVVALFVVANSSTETLDPVIMDALVFMSGAFVIATAATSHVIYGLQAQVRDAKRLGQYQLGQKLGEGGMGVVYKATHIMLRRPTAVKLLPIDKAGAETIARFEREVQETSRLEHPNSVSIYDYGRTPDGQFYYAMEYLDGITLQDLVDSEGPISVDRAVSILRQAANALAEAHALGLVHRDIKPANIMLCRRALVPDTVKVLDFGLVKAVDDSETDSNLTHINTVIGTPHYLAPEAITRPNDVGAQADVYALAATGFFLVTGREVFTAGSVIEICAKHLDATPESPGAVLGSPVDAGFEALLLRCLSKKPEDRPPDGAALAEELERLALNAWTIRDARAWWQAFAARRVSATAPEPVERTQLAIEVKGRQ